MPRSSGAPATVERRATGADLGDWGEAVFAAGLLAACALAPVGIVAMFALWIAYGVRS